MPRQISKRRAGRLAAAAAASPGSTRRVAGTQPERHRAQCRGLLLRLGEARFAGEFRLWAGRKEASAANRPTTPPRTARPEPTAPPASRETALAHIANIRKMLNVPTNAGDIAAQVMQVRGWQPHPANAAAKRVVTALRSDDPRHTNNAGKSQFLLRAAYMMMAAPTLIGQLPRPMGFVHRPPSAQVPASAGPTGWSHPRYAQAPTAYRPYPGRSLLRLFELIPIAPPGALSCSNCLCATHRAPVAFLIPLTS